MKTLESAFSTLALNPLETPPAQTTSAGASAHYSPRSAQHINQYQQMKTCWSFYRTPPKAQGLQARSPQANLQEAARLGHFLACKQLFEQRANHVKSQSDFLPCQQWARRAIRAFEATVKTNRLSDPGFEMQPDRLRCHYAELVNDPNLDRGSSVGQDEDLWQPTPEEQTALMQRIRASLPHWSPSVSADVELLVEGLLATHQTAQAVAIYQEVLNALPYQTPAWY